MGGPFSEVGGFGPAGMMQRQGLGHAKAVEREDDFECKYCHARIPLGEADAVLEHMKSCDESAPADVEFRKQQEERVKELAKLYAGAQNMGITCTMNSYSGLSGFFGHNYAGAQCRGPHV